MTYSTTAGDMWDFISYKTLGSEKYTPHLLKANPQFLSTIIFKAGVELEIPEIEEEKTSDLPPWRK